MTMTMMTMKTMMTKTTMMAAIKTKMDVDDHDDDLVDEKNDGYTPEEDPMPEEPKPPWEPKVSRPWSLLASPQSAKAPFKESIEGVGDVISPDFCLTMPRRTGPDKVADPRSSMLASHTFLCEWKVSSWCGRFCLKLWC